MYANSNASMAPDEAARRRTQLWHSAQRKNAWRLLPLLIAALILSYIDKNNAGFAALTMIHDLGMTPAQFGFGAGLLFVGYCALEVPSNLALYRYGARRWLARIMITWGLATAATALVTGPHGFYALRLVLGAAEAGLFPGATFLLACWFPAEYRTRILAIFMLGAPLASVIGNPTSGLLFQLNGVLGLQGWQWMFIAQGLPAALIGIAILFVVRDYPSEAHWLTSDERDALNWQLSSESRDSHKSTFAALKDPRIYLLGVIQFGFVIGTYGVGVWLPLILKEYGYGALKIGMLSAIPYVVACVGTYVWARFADRDGRHAFHLRMICLVGTIGFIVSALSLGVVVQLTGISLAVLAVFAARAVFWAIPTRFLDGKAAAGGLALINTIGTLGGFVGTTMVGELKQIYGTFAAGIWAMAAAFFVSALLTFLLGRFEQRRHQAAPVGVEPNYQQEH
jgi:MFS family permease